MKIRFGGTRVVIVTKHEAYKIARFCPFKTLSKIVMSVLVKKEFKRLTKKHKNKKLKIIIKSIFSGVLANRAEWRKWNESHSDEFIPVVSIYLQGLIIVQPRARRVTEDDILQSALCYRYVGDLELSRAEQYGRFDGRVILVDYAHLGARW